VTGVAKAAQEWLRRRVAQNGSMAQRKSLGKEDAPLSARGGSVRRAVRSYFGGGRRESFASLRGFRFRLWLGRLLDFFSNLCLCFPWMQVCHKKGRRLGKSEDLSLRSSSHLKTLRSSQFHSLTGNRGEG